MATFIPQILSHLLYSHTGTAYIIQLTLHLSELCLFFSFNVVIFCQIYISRLFKSCPQNCHLKISLLISQIRAQNLESITLGGNKIINNSTKFKKGRSSLTFRVWSPTAHSSLFSSASSLLSCNPFHFKSSLGKCIPLQHLICLL